MISHSLGNGYVVGCFLLYTIRKNAIGPEREPSKNELEGFPNRPTYACSPRQAGDLGELTCAATAPEADGS